MYPPLTTIKDARGHRPVRCRRIRETRKDNMITGTVLERDLAAHLEGQVERTAVDEACRDFARIGHAKMSFLAPPSVKQAIADEVHELLDTVGVRRDLRFRETGDTPRRMRNVTREQIVARGAVVPLVYRCEPLLKVLGDIAGEPVHPCPYEPEQFVITSLDREGDTHGWHWDDYAFALVWIIESPPVEDGGFVQFVPGTTWDKDRPAINEAFVQQPIHSMALAPGDLYFIRTDTTLHRVYPIKNGRRRIVNMGYASSSNLAQEPSHETMDQLWSAPSAELRS
jgi:hypothetical protein